MRNLPSSSRRLQLLAGAATVAFLHPGDVQAATVGTAGAANTRSTGTPPGSGMRVIEIGTQVVTNEKIETSASGSVQLLFIDKTTLNIGPNSTVVIDKFVFNPATAQGEMAITLGKGVLRVVGGQATHTGGATITTPVATIGLRGAIVTAKHSSTEGTQGILGYGVMTMASGGVTQTVTRPGFFVQTFAANSPPSQPAKASAAQIDQSNASVTSKGGQSGGSTAKPTDQQAAAANIGTTTSVAAPLIITPTSATAKISTLATTIAQIAGQGAQASSSKQSADILLAANQSPPPPPAPPPPPPPAPPPPPPPVPTKSAAYALVTTADSGLGSGVPYLTASFAGSGGFTVSPILGYRAGGLKPDGTPRTTSHILQAGLKVSGSGISQTSQIFVMTGEVGNDTVFGWTQGGGFAATGRLSSTHVSVRADGTVSSLPSSIQVDSDGLPTGSFGTNQNRFDTLPTSHYTSQTAFTNATSPPANYTYSQTSSRAATPTGLGSDHPDAYMIASVGGIMQTVTFNPANAASGTASAPFAINGAGYVFLLGSSSRMGAAIGVANVTSGPGQMQAALFNFGAANPNDPMNSAGLNGARAAYIDRTNFGARSETLYNNGVDQETSAISDATGFYGNGSGFNASQSVSRTGLLMVTANTVGANTSSFLTSLSTTTVQPCQCEYTQWGFWSADTLRTDTTHNMAYSDRGNLMLWQAGILAKAADIPTTGSATYTGHAVADISSSGSQYIAAGTFTNTVNFASKNGIVQIAGLDGSTYGGSVSFSGTAPYFAGSLNTGPSSRNMSMVGQFYQGGPSNSTPLYGEMGGSFNIVGSGPSAGYLGSGVFVGRK